VTTSGGRWMCKWMWMMWMDGLDGWKCARRREVTGDQRPESKTLQPRPRHERPATALQQTEAGSGLAHLKPVTTSGSFFLGHDSIWATANVTVNCH
jgi:hypothetical protein